MLPQTSPRHFRSRRQKRVMLLLVCAFFMTGATTIASAAGIHSAAKRGKVAKVEALLEKKPTLLESRKGKYANRWTNTRDNTPLHLAAVYGRPKVVELLLQKGATVDARNGGGYTPLHFAAMNKHREVAELLLAKGADPSARDDAGGVPLHLAVLPIGGGVKMDGTGRAWFSGPHAGTELVELLLAQGVDINVRNDRGNTPLHTAAWIADTDKVIELLLAQGADKSITSNSGWTPLMLAEHYGQKANAKLLRVALSASGSAVSQSRSVPPSTPLPSSAFSVEFVPAGAEQYPPTDVEDVKRFKNVLYWLGEADLIRGDEKPARPYIKIGELRFGEDWYYSSNIAELVNTHVPEIGGDAVLVYHAYQIASAVMTNDETGASAQVFYQSIMLEVIRYTDR